MSRPVSVHSGVVALCTVRGTLFLGAALFLLAFAGVMATCSRSLAEGLLYGAPLAAAGVWAVVAYLRECRRCFTRWWAVGGMAIVIACLSILMDLTAYLQYRSAQMEKESVAPVWNPQTSLFDWGSAQVKLPPGFTHRPRHGIDTFVGEFRSDDGSTVIQYDIGELAGEHGGIGRSDVASILGSRIKVARSNDVEGAWTAISFPDSGCANFLVTSPTETPSPAVEALIQSFQPITGIPQWLLMLLPDRLRSDCRCTCHPTDFGRVGPIVAASEGREA